MGRGAELRVDRWVHPDITPTAPMNCRELRARHLDFTDGTLPHAERTAVEARSACCPACVRFDRAVRRASLIVGNLPPVAPTPQFQARLRARIVQERWASRGAALRSRRRRVSLLAASLLAASALGAAAGPLAWGSPRTSRPRDLAVVSIARRHSSAWSGSSGGKVPATVMFTDRVGTSRAAPLWWAGAERTDTPARFSDGGMLPAPIFSASH